MAGEYVFNLMRVTKQYNKVTVLDDVSLAFFFGAKIGVIGGNGSGKSSLLRILGGIDTEFMGEALIAKNMKIGYLPQEPQLDPTKDVAGNVDEGVAEARKILARYDEICEKLSQKLPEEESEKLNDELGRLQDQIDTHELWELDHQIESGDGGVAPAAAGRAGREKLSGGEKRRVALCRLLISNPDVLLLDEPTNHLDTESVAWLETYLKKFKGTLVVVTHDRYFLNNVTEWILELDGGHTYPYKGNYEAWLVQKQALLEMESKQAASRRKLLDQELQWVRLNPAGRQVKNKARLKRYEELANQQVDTREDTLEIQIPAGARLGDLVVRAEDLSKAFGERLIMENVTFDLPRGGIVGVIGANGAGKTTLFKMIIGQEKADIRNADRREVGCRFIRRPVSRRAEPGEDGLRGNLRRRGNIGSWRTADEQPRVLRAVQLQRHGPAEARRQAFRRRAEPRASRQAPAQRRQPAPARRADERPRREHVAGAGGRPDEFRRLRGRRQPRPLVPGPHRHAHPRVRGRQQGDVVRGELRGLPRTAAETAGRQSRPAATDQVPAGQPPVIADLSEANSSNTPPRQRTVVRLRRHMDREVQVLSPGRSCPTRNGM